MRGQSITVAGLAAKIARPEPLPVVDETGITRAFDLDLAYMWYPMPDDREPGWHDAWAESNFSLLAKALLDQYGLKLDPHPGKAPLPTVVIESVTLPTPD